MSKGSRNRRLRRDAERRAARAPVAWERPYASGAVAGVEHVARAVCTLAAADPDPAKALALVLDYAGTMLHAEVTLFARTDGAPGGTVFFAPATPSPGFVAALEVLRDRGGVDFLLDSDSPPEDA